MFCEAESLFFDPDPVFDPAVVFDIDLVFDLDLLFDLGTRVSVNPRLCVEHFLDDSFMATVLQHTNEELQRRRQKRTDQQLVCYEDFDLLEIIACIGLLIIAGVMSSKGESPELMWSETFGPPILRATMPLKRFMLFLFSARFDDKCTRKERVKSDKLAAIRSVFDAFAAKCRNSYRPSSFVCVDETLVGFRGRCPFRVYIPSKPDRYGIKIWPMCDNGTNYICNLQAYLGKVGSAVERHQGARVVADLAEPLFGSGRNITIDNFFTSYALGQTMLSKNPTILGTIRKNKTELPQSFVPARRPEHESTFGFTADTTLVSYAPKKNKSVRCCLQCTTDPMWTQTGKDVSLA